MKVKPASKISKSKIITRQCVICGGEIFVTVFSNGSYDNGNYFGATRLSRNPFIKKAEYWECDKCYKNEE